MQFRTKKDGKHYPLSGRHADSGTYDRVKAQNKQKGFRTRTVNGIRVEEIEDSDGDIRIRFTNKDGDWFDMPEDDAMIPGNIKAFAKDFKNQWENRVGQYQEDNEDYDNGDGVLEGSEPTHMDYVKASTGSLGSKTSVAQVDGDFLGEFDSEDEADEAIREHMKRSQIYSAVWSQSDHGNNHIDTSFRTD